MVMEGNCDRYGVVMRSNLENILVGMIVVPSMTFPNGGTEDHLLKFFSTPLWRGPFVAAKDVDDGDGDGDGDGEVDGKIM